MLDSDWLKVKLNLFFMFNNKCNSFMQQGPNKKKRTDIINVEADNEDANHVH
jgi:hypothetical protein